MNVSEQLENGPDLARWLGFGGLIPFVFCATMAHSGNQQLAAYSLVGIANYGAVILSFVGAVHWGLAMQGERHPYWYAWSITPALLGWAAITLLGIRLGILALVPAFTLAWSVDRQAFLRALLPVWYMRLRNILTVGAVLALILATFAPVIE